MDLQLMQFLNSLGGNDYVINRQSKVGVPMFNTTQEDTQDEVNEKINILIDLIPTCDNFKIVAQMKNIVPEFISNNSVYSCLDKKLSI